MIFSNIYHEEPLILMKTTFLPFPWRFTTNGTNWVNTPIVFSYGLDIGAYRYESIQCRNNLSENLRKIVEMITGHFRLRKHLQTLGKVFEPDCRKCGTEEETAHHIVCECPGIKSIRVRLYGKPLLVPEEVMEEPLSKIGWFASETGLLN